MAVHSIIIEPQSGDSGFNVVAYDQYSGFPTFLVMYTNTGGGVAVFDTTSQTYGSVVTTVGAVDYSFMPIAAASKVSNKIYGVTKVDSARTYLVNLTNSTAIQLCSALSGTPVGKVDISSLDANGNGFGLITLSATTSAYVVFTDIDGGITVADTVSAKYTQISGSGYGYYTVTFGDVVLHQVKNTGGVVTTKTLSSDIGWSGILASDPVNKLIYIQENTLTGVNVVVIDEETFTRKSILTTSADFNLIGMSSDGKYIQYSGGTGEVYVQAIPGTDVTNITPTLSSYAPGYILDYPDGAFQYGSAIGIGVTLDNVTFKLLLTTIELTEYIGIWPKALFLRLRLLGYF